MQLGSPCYVSQALGASISGRLLLLILHTAIVRLLGPRPRYCSSQRDWQEENVKQERLRAAAAYCSAWAAEARYATWALRKSCNKANDNPFME